MNKVEVQAFFDEVTKSVSYVLSDEASKQAAVIDPTLDFDPKTRSLGTDHADQIIAFLDDNNLQLEWILETYSHSEHITAASYLKEQRGGEIGVSEHITKVQHTFKKAFNFDDDMPCDGREFDYLFQDGEVINLGHIEMEVIACPGHTPASASYKIQDAVFVGNSLLMPDVGVARTDFPCSSAKSLYQSIQRILSLPGSTRVFVGCDSKPSARKSYEWETTVLQEKRHNIHLKDCRKEVEFVCLRERLDKELPSYDIVLPLINVNIRAGRFLNTIQQGWIK